MSNEIIRAANIKKQLRREKNVQKQMLKNLDLTFDISDEEEVSDDYSESSGKQEIPKMRKSLFEKVKVMCADEIKNVEKQKESEPQEEQKDENLEKSRSDKEEPRSTRKSVNRETFCASTPYHENIITPWRYSPILSRNGESSSKSITKSDNPIQKKLFGVRKTATSSTTTSLASATSRKSLRHFKIPILKKLRASKSLKGPKHKPETIIKKVFLKDSSTNTTPIENFLEIERTDLGATTVTSRVSRFIQAFKSPKTQPKADESPRLKILPETDDKVIPKSVSSSAQTMKQIESPYVQPDGQIAGTSNSVETAIYNSLIANLNGNNSSVAEHQVPRKSLRLTSPDYKRKSYQNSLEADENLSISTNSSSPKELEASVKVQNKELRISTIQIDENLIEVDEQIPETSKLGSQKQVKGHEKLQNEEVKEKMNPFVNVTKLKIGAGSSSKTIGTIQNVENSLTTAKQVPKISKSIKLKSSENPKELEQPSTSKDVPKRAGRPRKVITNKLEIDENLPEPSTSQDLPRRERSKQTFFKAKDRINATKVKKPSKRKNGEPNKEYLRMMETIQFFQDADKKVSKRARKSPVKRINNENELAPKVTRNKASKRPLKSSVNIDNIEAEVKPTVAKRNVTKRAIKSPVNMENKENEPTPKEIAIQKTNKRSKDVKEMNEKGYKNLRKRQRNSSETPAIKNKNKSKIVLEPKQSLKFNFKGAPMENISLEGIDPLPVEEEVDPLPIEEAVDPLPIEEELDEVKTIKSPKKNTAKVQILENKIVKKQKEKIVKKMVSNKPESPQPQIKRRLRNRTVKLDYNDNKSSKKGKKGKKQEDKQSSGSSEVVDFLTDTPDQNNLNVEVPVVSNENEFIEVPDEAFDLNQNNSSGYESIHHAGEVMPLVQALLEDHEGIFRDDQSGDFLLQLDNCFEEIGEGISRIYLRNINHRYKYSILKIPAGHYKPKVRALEELRFKVYYGTVEFYIENAPKFDVRKDQKVRIYTGQKYELTNMGLETAIIIFVYGPRICLDTVTY